MTVEINLSDDEYKTVSEYAADRKIGIAEFFLNAALEQIEDAKWRASSRKIIERNREVYEALAK